MERCPACVNLNTCWGSQDAATSNLCSVFFSVRRRGTEEKLASWITPVRPSFGAAA